MRKTLTLFCLVVAFGAFISSCTKSDSYAERVKKEKKAIEGFISDNKIVVLSLYPANSKFAANEFYKDASGVYIHVVDTGNGKRALAADRAEVSVRFANGMTLPAADSDTITNDGSGQMPINFLYGVTSTYQSSSTGYYNYYFLSPALTLPLKYVGEGATVKLIIPFSQGSYSQMNETYVPMYIGKVKYTKIYNNE